MQLAVPNTYNCVAMWRRFYFLKTTQQSTHRYIFVFIFAPCLCSRRVEGCLAELTPRSENSCADRLFESRRDKTKRKSVVGVRVRAAKKRLGALSYLPRRERDACELKQEIAGNVPGMRIVCSRENQKKKTLAV
jgi:hypothetical protein